ncbi:MAG: hypothetical protein U0522_02140 [Candidatus Paceibacterota bacterium]
MNGILPWIIFGVMSFWLLSIAAARDYWPWRKWSFNKTAVLTACLVLAPIAFLMVAISFRQIRAQSQS